MDEVLVGSTKHEQEAQGGEDTLPQKSESDEATNWQTVEFLITGATPMSLHRFSRLSRCGCCLTSGQC
jgi:hypothetical protein